MNHSNNMLLFGHHSSRAMTERDTATRRRRRSTTRSKKRSESEMRMMEPPLSTTTTNLCSPIVSSSTSRFNLKPRPHLRLRGTGGVGALVTPHHTATSGGTGTAVTATRISFSPVMMEALQCPSSYRTRRKESVEDCSSSISGDDESPFCSPIVPSTPPPLPQAEQAVPRANYIYEKTPSLLLPDPCYLNRALSLVDREEEDSNQEGEGEGVSVVDEKKMSFGFPDLFDDEFENEKKKFKKGRRILKVNYNNIKQKNKMITTTTSSSLASSSNKSTLTHLAAVTPNTTTAPV